MTVETDRGVVRGGIVVLLRTETPLTDGTEVLVTPVAAGPGTPAAVLAATQTSSLFHGERVNDLEQEIGAGRSSPNRNDPFAEEDDRQETSCAGGLTRHQCSQR